MHSWLGLVIGNSRLHWALFTNGILQKTWDTEHLVEKIDSSVPLNKIIPNSDLETIGAYPIKIYLASVVPAQTALWCDYPLVRYITLQDIPLLNVYPTLGIDRALAVFGAGETYGYPCLVIDAGTALTFTAVDNNQSLIGGAILLGLRSHIRALNRQTAALPKINLPSSLPLRWALNTEEAIASGLVYTVIAGISNYITDWSAKFPRSSIILTGGDRELIFSYLQILEPEITKSIIVDRQLIFWGLKFSSLLEREN